MMMGDEGVGGPVVGYIGLVDEREEKSRPSLAAPAARPSRFSEQIDGEP